MDLRVHFTNKNAVPISKSPSDLYVVIVNDDNKIIDEGWFWMKGSRKYKTMPKHWNDRPRKGEYWYSVAHKAGQRFARQFTKTGALCFRLPDKFLRKVTRDVILYTGKAKDILWAEFKSGFYTQLRKDNPALFNNVFDLEESVDLFYSKTDDLSDCTLIFANITRHERPCVIELLSELSKTERLLLEQETLL